MRVIAAMSGGVDSSVMAALLREAGVEVVGVFLNVWEYRREEVAGHGSCCSLDDAYDARRVADTLEIPFYNMDMRSVFRREVIDPFIADYAAGRTPNPCARCNRFVKFGSLLEAARRLDAPFVATGHYVRRVEGADGPRFLMGRDRAKDQSYFLATTTADGMRRLLFPVGEMEKDDTRRLAAHFGLPTAHKAESQDICFIPNGDRIAFLRAEGGGAGLMPGEIVDERGNVLGRHDGIARFTIGQRRGLGLAGGPWRVVRIDVAANRVIVARDADIRIRRVRLRDWQWLRRPSPGTALSVRLRYRMTPAICRMDPDGWLTFDAPQQPSAPGQVAAVYVDEELIGGGIVAEMA
ncbi:MAG: tRNA 2-thiouridine(34) synthase MnmA [Mariprofundaceae bacterium]